MFKLSRDFAVYITVNIKMLYVGLYRILSEHFDSNILTYSIFGCVVFSIIGGLAEKGGVIVAGSSFITFSIVAANIYRYYRLSVSGKKI